jgi:hypothetical protein
MKKHQPSQPNAAHKKPVSIREIRRACNKELYRTVKRMAFRPTPDQFDQAHMLYFNKVIQNIVFVTEHRDNRKLLSDWWSDHVAPEIAELWGVESEDLCDAFKRAFGG